MPQDSQVNPTSLPIHPRDSYTFAPRALEKILGLGAREIPGVLALRGNVVNDLTASFIERNFDPTRGVITETHGHRTEVYLRLALQYGADGKKIFQELRDHLSEQLATLTGYELAALHVEVVDIMTEAEFETELRNRFRSYSPGFRS